MAKGLIINIDGDDSGLKKTLSGIGKTAKAGLGVAVKGIAATSAGLAGLGTMAVKGYAEYEQLIGGVDTLFKTSSEKVQSYAAKAYETAGLSANEYMETATGFAASLKQSFDDTAEGLEAAADCADMAVIDMADNANKMGTDMQAIRVAYQGFAKQNYTMLDNLKLGYGGTKTEMERLLADAEKLSGIHYNIDSLADVYNAIHVIQTELGITGTTAEEAATTISGSINMAKAAAQNLIVGLSDSNADLDELMQNFIDAVLTVGDNLLPAVKTTLNGIASVVKQSGKTFIPKLVDVILSALPQLTSAAATLVTTLAKELIRHIPQLVKTAKEMIAAFADALGESVPLLKPAAKIVKLLADHIDTLSAVVGNATTAVIGYKGAIMGLSVITKVSGAFKAAQGVAVAFAAAAEGAAAAEVAEVAASMALEGTLKPLSVITGVVTGKIKLQTAATVALAAAKKLLTDHVGLLVAAGVALTAGLVTLCVRMQTNTEAEKERAARLSELKNRTEELTEASEEQSEAYQSAIQSINTSASSEIAELDRTKELADELMTLADENGNVEEANRGRAAYILGELNGAMDTEYTMVDNQIQKYGDLRDSIYDTIDAMQAEIVLSAYKDQLTEAIKRQTEAQENAAGAAENILKAEEDKAAVVDEYVAKYNDLTDFTITAAEAEKKLADGTAFNSLQLSGIVKRYREYEEVIAANTERIEESGAASKEVAALKEKVSDASTAYEQGNFEKVVNGYQLSEDAKKAIASGSQADMVTQLRTTYDELERLETQRDKATTENQKDEWQRLIDETATQGQQLIDALGGIGVDAVEGLAQSFRDDGKAEAEATSWAQRIVDVINGVFGNHSPSRVMRDEVGGNMVKGLVLGFGDGENPVSRAAKRLAESGVDGYNAGQDAHSPAKEYIKASKNSIDGLIKGIDDNADELTDRMKKLAGDELEAAMSETDALLESERVYLSEKSRMEREADEAEYREKLAAAKTAQAAQKVKNDYRQKQQEEADKRYLEQLEEVAEAERKLVEEQKNRLIDFFEEMTDAATDAMEDLADKQADFKDKLLGSRELFFEKTITFKGAGEDGGDLVFNETHLGDLEAQNKALQEYADLLFRVRERGELPSGFFDELRDMSMEEGTTFAKALLEADDETFNAYLASWQSIEETGERLSKEIFKDEFAEMERSLTETFGELPENFFNIGEESIQKFGSGFMSKLGELLADVREQIQASLAYLAPVAAVSGGTSGGSSQTTTNNTVTYNLTAAGSTISEQLQAIRNAETVKRLRG